jgi:hypothetical protein
MNSTHAIAVVKIWTILSRVGRESILRHMVPCFRYVAHLWRRSKRRLLKKYRLYRYRRQQQREQKQAGDGATTPVMGAITLHQYRGTNGSNGSGKFNLYQLKYILSFRFSL